MSYQYRKRKRERAHEILQTLYEALNDNFRKGKTEKSYINILDFFTSDADEIVFIHSVLLLLFEHKDIFKKKIDGPDELITISDKGLDTLKTSYYLVENRKDYLESIEYITKWIIPVLSILLSIAAFIISIVVLIHTWNKR